MNRVSPQRMKKTSKLKPKPEEFEFTLALSGIHDVTSEVEDALYEAGCDDATLTVRSGRVFLTFSRMASSLKDAILSAIKDVRNAGIGADVLRLDVCDLVTQADIARKIGRSRQQVHQFIQGTRGPGGFPPPAGSVTDHSPLWFWAEVAEWLWNNNIIHEKDYAEAQMATLFNDVLGVRHRHSLEPSITREVFQKVLALKSNGLSV
jgi:hypothetical protein